MTNIGIKQKVSILGSRSHFRRLGRGIMAMGLGTAIVSTALTTLAAAPASATTSIVTIQPELNPRKCLDADTNTINNNPGRAQSWDCNNSAQQRWTVSDDSGASVFRSVLNSRKCLDADTNTININPGRVQEWDCNGSMQQKWYVLEDKTIHSALNPNKCLDADTNTINSNPGWVHVWDCNNTPQQRWSGVSKTPFMHSADKANWAVKEYAGWALRAGVLGCIGDRALKTTVQKSLQGAVDAGPATAPLLIAALGAQTVRSIGGLGAICTAAKQVTQVVFDLSQLIVANPRGPFYIRQEGSGSYTIKVGYNPFRVTTYSFKL